MYYEWDALSRKQQHEVVESVYGFFFVALVSELRVLCVKGFLTTKSTESRHRDHKAVA